MSHDISMEPGNSIFDQVSSVDMAEEVETGDGLPVVWTDLPRSRPTMEGVMGLLAAFFIGLPSPIVAAAAVAQLPQPFGPFLPIAMFFLSGYLSITVVRLASRALEGDGNPSFAIVVNPARPSPDDLNDDEVFIPLALAMAIRLPNWLLFARPFVAVWWLCHFVAAALIGHAAAGWLNSANNPNLFVALPLTLLVTFAFLFAANLYLMLAIAVCVRRPGIWLIAWRNRFVVDFIIAAILLVANG